MSSSSSSSILETLQYYLTSHPTILNFSWSPPETPLSSLPSLLLTILTYLSLSLLLHLFHPFHLPSPLLHLISSLHNSILLLLSLTMALSTSLSSFLHLPSLSHLFCFPPSPNANANGPLFFWAYIFYLSKFYELFDTLLILLNPNRTLTFLHVYHHSLVLVMCYVWLETRQSLMPLALVTNASVHVVMYGYYLSSSLGWRWPVRWKRVVTEVQIWQFVASFGFSVVFLWMHFVGGGCEGMKGWVFNAVFNASLLGLFLKFHAGAYKRKKERKEE